MEVSTAQGSHEAGSYPAWPGGEGRMGQEGSGQAEGPRGGVINSDADLRKQGSSSGPMAPTSPSLTLPQLEKSPPFSSPAAEQGLAPAPWAPGRAALVPTRVA